MAHPISSHFPTLKPSFLVTILVFSLSLKGQVTPRFENISTEQGLAQGVVTATVQDNKGFLWISTETGLNRYDGYSMDLFTRDPTGSGLSDSHISTLFVDSRGTLWVGTAFHGLNRYKGDNESFVTYHENPQDPHALVSDRIWDMAEDPSGDLWIATTYGLSHFDPKTERFTSFVHQPETSSGLPHRIVLTLHVDQEGLLWVGTHGGLCKIDTETLQIQPVLQPQLEGQAIWAIEEDAQGVLLFGTSRGLYELDRKGSGSVRRPDSPELLKTLPIQALLNDRQGNLWVGTNQGLFLRDNVEATWVHCHPNPLAPGSLSDRDVASISEDRGGIIWVGTGSGGLDKHVPSTRAFHHIRHDPLNAASTILSNTVTGLSGNDDGLIWVATDQGVSQLDKNGKIIRSFVSAEDSKGPAPAYITSLLEDHRGDLWVGHSGNMGLDRLAHGERRFRRYRDLDGLPNNMVLTIFEDRNQQLWIGSSAGLARYDPITNRFQRINHFLDAPNGLKEKTISDIVDRSAGELWLATTDGLKRLDLPSGEVTTWSTKPGDADSLSHDHISSLLFDEQHGLWVGTFGGGLNYFDLASERFKVWTQVDGLMANTVCHIQRDDLGYLWVATAAGLSRLDPSKNQFLNFGRVDGLPGNDINMGAGWRSPDGDLFYGSNQGLFHFSPRDIHEDSFVPEVAITDFLLFNESVPLGEAGSPLEKSPVESESLSLSYWQNVFSLEFSNLYFNAPNKHHYAFKLEGLHDQWIYTDSQKRFATFTNLDPGSYVFRVKGKAQGAWSNKERVLDIHVGAPPWKTGPAFALYLALGVACIWLYIRFQRRKLIAERAINQKQRALNERLQQLDQIKDDFLANTSHELRTPLNGIIGLTESLLDGAVGDLDKDLSHNLHMIVNSGRRLAGLVNDLLEFTRLKNHQLKLKQGAVDVRTLAEVVITLLRPLLGDRPLQLLNRIEAQTPMVLADENRLTQVLYNLLGNGVKFTESGEVSISAHYNQEKVTFSVTDTGPGIEEKDLKRIFSAFEQGDSTVHRVYEGTGLGLTISRQLLLLHGSEVEVRSKPGQGSCFTFSLPIYQGSQEAKARSKEQELPVLMPFREVDPAPYEGQEDNYHILIVDDDPVNRQVLSNRLKLSGYRITRASGGEEALKVVGQTKVDLILLDIMMPGMSGFEVCKRLREDRGPQELSIIFLTARDASEDSKIAFAVGGNDYLTKPVDSEALLSRVKTQLELVDHHRRMAKKVAEKTRELRERNGELSQTQRVLMDQAHQLEEQAWKLQSLNEMQNRFFTNINHDLRTPLSLIIGPAKDLLQSLQPEDMERRAQYELLLRNANHLLDLVNQLLEVSRLEAGRLPLQMKHLDLAELVASGLAQFQDASKRLGVTLTSRLDASPLMCFVDAQKVTSILNNLVANALKFTPSGGRVVVSLEKKGDLIEFGVRDSGPGIEAARLPHIFDRFRQGKATSNWTTGSGLGLSLTRELVLLHGGEIQPVNHPEGGCTFKVTLSEKLLVRLAERVEGQPDEEMGKPETLLDSFAVAEPTKPKGDQAASSSDSRPILVLVEDNSDLRNYLLSQLKSDYTLFAARDGSEGIKLVWEHLPDLVISDVVMPQLDGFDLTNILKNDPRSSHIPIILLTARTSEKSRVAGLRLGADAYLGKPFSLDELKATIGNLIANRERLRVQFSKEMLLQPRKMKLESADERFLNKVMDILDRHMSEPGFGVFELADKVGFGRRQLLRKMTALTNKGPADFIRAYRMERATQMLRKRSASVTEISAAVGFQSASKFAAQFRKIHGKTPTQYMADS